MTATKKAKKSYPRTRQPNAFQRIALRNTPEWSRMPSRLLVPGLAQRVLKLRAARGWTQAQLAAKARIADEKICAIERETNRASMTFALAIRLAEALDTSLDYLAGMSRDPTPRR
jgi:DNA-binding XRE family transcriptional regulator